MVAVFCPASPRNGQAARRLGHALSAVLSFCSSTSGCICGAIRGRTLRSPRLVRFLFRNIAPRLVVQNWNVVDDSSKMLVMEHELFQHIECECSCTRSRLAEAVDVVVQLLKHFGGDRDALTPSSRDDCTALGLLDCSRAAAVAPIRITTRSAFGACCRTTRSSPWRAAATEP